ncbi:MAG: tRNA adenosine(34) deaminase TadA [Lachnospiraceae bacterium]|nr:tRNA adenosine(34) deaminase TadA [Lachnospiraceae bacterium]
MRRTRSAYIIRRRAGLWQEPEGGIYLKKDKAAAKQAAREQKEAERLRQARLQQKQDEKYMRQAITQAKKAEKIGEVPIGCVIVYDGKVIGRGYNRRKIDKNTLSHAELTAIRKASKVMGDWRLEECTLYVTLEPCQMCAGAIVQARIPRVVMGCMNPKAGCGGSILNLLEMKEFNHQVDVTRGVLESECSRILTDFFASLRKRLKTEKET